MPTKADKLRETALALYDEGRFVIPCRPGTKVPMIKWGPKADKPSRKRLEKFWTDRPDDPPQVAMRLDAGDLILDLDPDHEPKVKGLYETLKGETRCATSPSGGLHAYYKLTGAIKPRALKGLDVLTKGRMVVVPPSEGRAWTGAKETVEVSANEGRKRVSWAIEGAGIHELSEGESLAREALTSLEKIPHHARNHTLASIAGVLRSAGFRGNRLVAALAGLSDYVTEQPEGDELTYDDVARIAESIDHRKPDPFDTPNFVRYEFNTTENPPPLKWFVRDFLPAEGVTSLFGLGKQGKSYLAMELLRSMTLGIPFLDMPGMGRPVKVLYVDWEKRGAALKRRLHALAGNEPFNVSVIEPNGSLPAMIETLRAQVAMGGFELMIVDSLTIALMQGDSKEATVIVPALFALNGLGIPVLVLDHMKKPSAGEPVESLTAYGSVFKGNVASMNWRVRKISGDPLGLNIAMQNAGNNFEVDPPDIHVRVSFEFGSQGELTKAAVERSSEMQSEDSDVWKHLSYQTEPTLDADIARDLRLTISSVRQTLKQLETAKRVRSEKGEGGTYWETCHETDDPEDVP